MIPSVNFIDKAHFRWTYKNFIFLSAGLIIASLAVGLWERYDLKRLQIHVAEMHTAVQTLQEKLKIAEPKQVSSADAASKEVFDLYERLLAMPKWSLVLGELFASLPRGLDLKSVEKTADRTLHVVGACNRPELLSYWLEFLKTQSTIELIVLLSTDTRPEQGNALGFSLDITLRGTS
jgi:hypothetical protein